MVNPAAKNRREAEVVNSHQNNNHPQSPTSEARMPNCSSCQVECRGKQCRPCYDAERRRDASNGTTYGLDSSQHLNVSQFDADLQLSNAAFTQGSDASEPDTPPTTLEEMFSIFLQMKSHFTKAVQERDVIIDALSKRVVTLEEAAKRAPKPSTNQGTADKVITDMKKEHAENIKTIKATVAAQQKTLEDLQHDKRVKNLVVTGIPESAGTIPDSRKEDQATTEAIFTAIGCPGVAPGRVTRLGKKREIATPGSNEAPPPPRPLLVTLNSVSEVRAIMNERHKLKDNQQYGRVFIKRDQHPLIRKEWNRLRDFARKEKAAPVNVGCTIKVDYERKAVTRDGVSILAFVSPFRDAGPNQSE